LNCKEKTGSKHYLIIFLVILIFAIVAFPVVTRIAFSFVDRALEITLSQEAKKGLFEGMLGAFIGGVHPINLCGNHHAHYLSRAVHVPAKLKKNLSPNS
jgi:hypothetical protein